MGYNTGDQLPPEARDEIVRLLRQGNKIQAIKIHRKFVSGTLKESKTAVESMAANLGIPMKSGCLAALTMVILVPLTVLLLMLPF